MSSHVSFNIRPSVREGRLDEAQSLTEEMVASTEQEPGTLGYEWFMADDGSCHIQERYADSAAALSHLGGFGAHFVERFMLCFEPTNVAVCGEPSDEVRSVLDGLGAVYLGPWGGSVR